MHRITLGGSLLVVLAAASSAHADPDLGAQGTLILSADRLSPLFTYTKSEQSDNNGSVSTTTSSLQLLWNGNAQDFYDVPRLGLDYAVAPNITIGGNLFATLPMSSKQEASGGGRLGGVYVVSCIEHLTHDLS